MIPINFTPMIHFNPEIHKIDQIAQLYLQQTSPGTANLVPIHAKANGNCLYNSIECINGGTVLTSSELRGSELRYLIASRKLNIACTIL